jgi:hypothetical protein
MSLETRFLALRSCAAVARIADEESNYWRQSQRNGSQLRLSRTQREAATGADAGVAQFTELDECEFLANTEKDCK